MRCYGCGADKYPTQLEPYPWPEADHLCDGPIEPLLVLEVQGKADLPSGGWDFRAAVCCHRCFYRLETECGGVDMWLGEGQWAGLAPLVPFAQLPRPVPRHPEVAPATAEFDVRWVATNYPDLLAEQGAAT